MVANETGAIRSSPPDRWDRVSRQVEAYSFFWMNAANVVGAWLALLLLFPSLGEWTGVLGYGRWMPLHMTWQLYGWCSLPLVGLLFRWILFQPESSRACWESGLALRGWSLAMALGGISWLWGESSGKLFLDWSGPSRVAFPLAMGLLWSVLILHAIRHLRFSRTHQRGGWLRIVLLGALALIPWTLFWASDRSVYPPVNPRSGGATGHSLLASSLGIIALILLIPYLLSRRAVGDRRHFAGVAWLYFVVCAGIYLFIEHGNASNHAASQIIGLGALIPWVPLLWLYLRGFDWNPGSRRWVGAFLFWWALLVVDGFGIFLPGVLEVAKFTNVMVAHAHLAMAGMVTALNCMILLNLTPGDRRVEWNRTTPFFLWNGGLAVFVLFLSIQGVREGIDPSVLFERDSFLVWAYSLRLIAGMAMLGASSFWWIKAVFPDALYSRNSCAVESNTLQREGAAA